MGTCPPERWGKDLKQLCKRVWEEQGQGSGGLETRVSLSDSNALTPAVDESSQPEKKEISS